MKPDAMESIARWYGQLGEHSKNHEKRREKINTDALLGFV